MLRGNILVLLLLSAACSRQDDTVTLCGEPIQHGGDPDAVSATIDHPQLPAVIVGSENGKVGIGVFQAGSCAPYLQLGDSNADGVFDFLTYSALSPAGETLVDVEDYGMDGQPDFILNHTDSTAAVFYQGAWYPVDGLGTSGDEPSVTIDGQRRALASVLEEIGRRPF